MLTPQAIEDAVIEEVETHATEEPSPPEPIKTPLPLQSFLPQRAWTRSWISVCLGIPPYLLPYMKYQKPFTQ